MRSIVGPAVLLLLLGGAFYFYQAKKKFIETDYQALFLDNGQVYFGRINKMGKKYVTITDVYYFGKDSNNPNSEDVVLLKLGSEVHGPTDEMKILENHILYIEKLSNDSRVVEAIREYKNQ